MYNPFDEMLTSLTMQLKAFAIKAIISIGLFLIAIMIITFVLKSKPLKHPVSSIILGFIALICIKVGFIAMTISTIA